MRPGTWFAAVAAGLASPAMASQPALKGAIEREAPAEVEPAPPPTPDPLMTMVMAAVANANDAEMAVIVKFAGKAAPERAAQFEAMADNRRKSQAAAQLAKQRDAPIYALWAGQVQLGGFLTTGNTDTVGLSIATKLAREGFRWRHKLDAAVDYQRDTGVTSRERYVASFASNYKFSARAYAVGIVQYENDRFLGYDARYSGSLGLGYRALEGNATLDIEAGPALRSTHYTTGGSQTLLAGRGSVDFNWKLSPAVSFTQNVSIYADASNSTVLGTSALSAKLFGPLSASLSYRVQYESQPIDNRKQVDTTSRASLVYDF